GQDELAFVEGDGFDAVNEAFVHEGVKGEGGEGGGEQGEDEGEACYGVRRLGAAFGRRLGAMWRKCC
ncbi:MAG: hypothetical protein FWF96_04215, partial [Kiritimatiellaeota bacterium]|nr:hypothetical protein [Kiritimatiellota bacterium]